MNKLFFLFKMIVGILLLGSLVVSLLGCPGYPSAIVPPTDATSASEVAEALVSGTVNATYTSGTQAQYRPIPSLNFFEFVWNEVQPLPKAWGQRVATGYCNTLPLGGTNCAVSGNVLTLTYPVCNYAPQSNITTWSGSEIITHTAGPTSTMTCGAFPPFNTGDVITRTFALSTNRITPPPEPVTVLIDTSQSVNGNPAVTASGITISYNDATNRDIVINGVHVAAGLYNYVVWNYAITSTVNIAVDDTNMVDSGTVVLEDLLHANSQGVNRTATATLSNLTYSAGCCMATGGTVSTVWSDGSPTENLVLGPSCGAATLNGNAITLYHCW